MSKGRVDELTQRIQELGPWIHQIDLGEGVRTRDIAPAPGPQPVDHPQDRWSSFEPWVPADLSGLRALDVGCADGFVAVELARRGAASVVALDQWPKAIDRVRFAREVLELRAIEPTVGSVYDLDESMGRFDVVFMLAVLPYLDHPLLALQRVSQLADVLFVETIATPSDHGAYLELGGNGNGDAAPPSVPATHGVKDMLVSVGLGEIVEIPHQPSGRVAYVAMKGPARPTHGRRRQPAVESKAQEQPSETAEIITESAPLRQGAQLHQEIRNWVNPGPAFEEFDTDIVGRSRPAAKVVAFHLPQFHAIPENDQWWGAGFTEWRNVARGTPRFVGHYQPRIPRDLGFYDLASPQVLRTQVALAKAAGIFGFAFYYYWFDGKRLLERPVDGFLNDPANDFPFCLLWANENWTRRWDGHNDDVLIGQSYDPSGTDLLIADIQRHFQDPRYIRIDGRPLFLLYRPDLVPEPRVTFARWREIWHSRYGEQPLLYMAQAFGNENPDDYGLDGAFEFPPHKLLEEKQPVNEALELLDSSFTGAVFDYESLVADSLADGDVSYPLIKTALPSWDNDARRQGAGLVVRGSTPERYEAWLRELIEKARQSPAHGEPFVFVNAWNEWAEAAYLEPDVHFGAAYLNATARAVSETVTPENTATKHKVLLVGHDAHPHGAQMILYHLGATLKDQFGCEVATLLQTGGEMLPQYARLGRVCNADHDIGTSRAFFSDLRADGYEIALTNTAVTGGLVPLLKSFGFRVVSLVHELPGIIEEYHLEDSVTAMLGASDEVIVPATIVQEALSEYGERPAENGIVVRPQGLYRQLPELVDPTLVRRELEIPASHKIVLNVGWGDLRKGIDLFLQVAKQAAASFPELHFVWVGNLRADVARWLQRGVAADAQVRFVPFTPDVDKYFAAADVFFLSSREDPFPSVALEALYAGLPLVALQGSTGVEDLAMEHGAVVRPDDTNEILRALSRLAQEDEEAQAARHAVVRDEFRYDDYSFDVLKLLSPATKKVTVAVPNFNYSDRLEERLLTIFSQTYPIFELLVLDDGSSDDSLMTLERVAAATGRRFEVITRTTNSGSPFQQWALACEKARGDYLWIAEADDLSRPDFLETIFSRHGESDFGFAFSDSTVIDENGEELAPSYKSYYRDGDGIGSLMDQDFSLDGETFVRRCLAERNLVLNASAVVWDRARLAAALETHLSEVTEYRLAGDWHLYAAVALSGTTVSYVSEPLNIHRRHEGSVTGSLEKRRHLDEVQRVHGSIAKWLPADADLLNRMHKYESALAIQFGLGADSENGTPHPHQLAKAP